MLYRAWEKRAVPPLGVVAADDSRLFRYGGHAAGCAAVIARRLNFSGLPTLGANARPYRAATRRADGGFAVPMPGRTANVRRRALWRADDDCRRAARH